MMTSLTTASPATVYTPPVMTNVPNSLVRRKGEKFDFGGSDKGATPQPAKPKTVRITTKNTQTSCATTNVPSETTVLVPVTTGDVTTTSTSIATTLVPTNMCKQIVTDVVEEVVEGSSSRPTPFNIQGKGGKVLAMLGMIAAAAALAGQQI